MYSFIRPRKKILFDAFTFLWIGFLSFVSIGFLFFGLYLNNQNTNFDARLKMQEGKLSDIQEIIEKNKAIIKDYKIAILQDKEVKRNNLLIKNGIQNIFLLIPNQITIVNLHLDKYSVRIDGVTDTPKTYKLLLEPPLKSIFDSSKVGFTKINNNKYLFTSFNKIKRRASEK